MHSFIHCTSLGCEFLSTPCLQFTLKFPTNFVHFWLTHQTIIDYDKVLVLGNGSMLEFGSPHQLIQDKGAFFEMVQVCSMIC